MLGSDASAGNRPQVLNVRIQVSGRHETQVSIVQQLRVLEMKRAIDGARAN